VREPQDAWHQPLLGLPGIAARRAELYAAAGLRTRRQLLYHLPVRYRLRPPAGLLAEQLAEQLGEQPAEQRAEQRAESRAAGAPDPAQYRVCALSGTVQRGSLRRRGRHSTVSLNFLCDGGGQVTVLLFNRAYLARSLSRGTRLWVAGRLSGADADHALPRLLAADYEVLDGDERDEEGPARVRAGSRAAGEPAPPLPPLPIYRLPVGVPPRVHRKLLAALLGPEEGARHVRDWRADLPAATAARLDSALDAATSGCTVSRLDLLAALRAIHLPCDLDAARAARQRLAEDEAFALSLEVAGRRRTAEHVAHASLSLDAGRHAQLLAWLPHVPTGSQARVLDTLRADLSDAEAPRPMSRLLQGDVGSGKTLVAFYALLAAVLNGQQAAIMAPTEVLAAQHVRALAALVARGVRSGAWPAGVRPAIAFVAGPGAAPPLPDPADAPLVQILSGAPARSALASGAALLAVGTHGLQSARVRFAALSVTVVDEQHRFGVRQRGRFREKGDRSHLLVMTATPIPRTLALTAYGELDVSVLDELPPGRAPRTTELVDRSAQRALWSALRQAVARGERGFVVCPSIGGKATEAAPLAGADDDADDTSVTQTLGRVRRALGADVAVGCVHGRLPAAERDAALAAFRGGELSVLVATVLIEVGIDVPQATWVVVPDASRFGLATLHQIRGRVGRGALPGRCIVLGPVNAPPARARVAALLASDDGFRLAEQDLALRGPGELLGTRQHGLTDFLALDPVRDVELLAAFRELALHVARPLSGPALAALRLAVFPELELAPEHLLAGG